MERLFITGGSGLLGSKFTRIAEDDYEVDKTYNKNPQKKPLNMDITDREDVVNKINSINLISSSFCCA